MSNQPLLLVCLNKREFSGVFIRQLLNRINAPYSILLWRHRLLRADFCEVCLVCGLESLRCLIELLLAYFLSSQSGIQILNILLIACVFARFWQEFLGCGLSFECVGRIPFYRRVLPRQRDLFFCGSFSERLLRIQDRLLATQIIG